MVIEFDYLAKGKNGVDEDVERCIATDVYECPETVGNSISGDSKLGARLNEKEQDAYVVWDLRELLTDCVMRTTELWGVVVQNDTGF